MKNEEYFNTFLEKGKKLIDSRLHELIKQLDAPQDLETSMLYSLEAGGKRVRPLLLLAVLKTFNQPIEIGLDAACAIEMIHTYSLIHDDLPAMDNDDLRRGKPTNHKVFGEALAILAGDALLTESFHVLTTVKNLTADQKLQLIHHISQAAGAKGMVAGQIIDMEGEEKDLTLLELEEVHLRKTGDLLTVALISGGIIAKASEKEISELKKFGQLLGLAFQIKDDILDVIGTEEEIGKPVGSDLENDKNTYPSILGIQKAEDTLTDYLQLAKNALEKLNGDAYLLKEFVEYIGYRNQ